MRITTEVEVDIDAEDVLDQLTDAELAEVGLLKIDASPVVTPWHQVRDAMRRGNARELADLLARLAWDQAGIILPTGIPTHH